MFEDARVENGLILSLDKPTCSHVTGADDIYAWNAFLEDFADITLLRRASSIEGRKDTNDHNGMDTLTLNHLCVLSDLFGIDFCNETPVDW